MIIKISKGDGSWSLLNDVRGVDYTSIARTARTKEEFDQKLDDLQKSLNGCSVRNALMKIDWSRLKSTSPPYKFSTLIVEHKDHSKTLVFFDHPVYLCDEAGNTVEKINIR